ncbi:hypothetical protein QFC19_004501 [Naganishia cerealis]|uniref:Uncharacterized protein n=1 Tax=Naganishia cerealis TaxID=610337 RepID=A0ACC2VVP9_9TREE|nr:hypothetical protein QFC19_004501 [Naganishia cerealis]
MRANYSEFGVDEVMFAFMDRWLEETGVDKVQAPSSSEHEELASEKELYLLDLAAGSGEATICLQEWYNIRSGTLAFSRHTLSPSSNPTASSSTAQSTIARPGALPNPLAALHASPGPRTFQARPAFIPPSRNPTVRSAVEPKGSGASPDLGMAAKQIPELHITATDPFTVSAYETRTSATCLPLSFQDVAEGKLPLPIQSSSRKYDLAICSFALHLVGDHSEMFSLLYELSHRANWLVVLAPHKKPEVSLSLNDSTFSDTYLDSAMKIKEGWGWIRWDISTWQDGRSKLYSGNDHGDEEDTDEPSNGSSGHEYRNGGLEIVIDRVRCRLYKSISADE